MRRYIVVAVSAAVVAGLTPTAFATNTNRDAEWSGKFALSTMATAAMPRMDSHDRAWLRSAELRLTRIRTREGALRFVGSFPDHARSILAWDLTHPATNTDLGNPCQLGADDCNPEDTVAAPVSTDEPPTPSVDPESACWLYVATFELDTTVGGVELYKFEHDMSWCTDLIDVGFVPSNFTSRELYCATLVDCNETDSIQTFPPAASESYQLVTTEVTGKMTFVCFFLCAHDDIHSTVNVEPNVFDPEADGYDKATFERNHV